MAYAKQMLGIDSSSGGLKPEEIVRRGEKLFSDRLPLLTMWQDIAEMFYPERADFIASRQVGNELAAGLATGYPVLVRRDLGNSLGAMLRPTNKSWFQLSPKQ